MTTTRLEAFSDGVIAIIITIMVLELHVADGATWDALRATWPKLLTYALSFIYLGIYWTNHHHLLHITKRVTGGILWANLHLLFWLSLVPVVTDWMGSHAQATPPTATYGIVLLLAALAYYGLQSTIIHAEGPASPLRAALGRDLKGKISPVIYAAAILAAFVEPMVSDALFVLVALMWLVPDRRIESRL